MTIEEKAKAYDKAIERAKNYYSTTDSVADTELIELIFPELKESEDERIRKALLEMVHDTTGDSLWVDYNVHKEDAIDWLEKQGEQKFSDIDNKFIRMRETKPKDISEFLDRLTTVEQEFLWEHIAKVRELDKEEQKSTANVEPKFKVGDWVVNKLGDLWHIDSSDKKNYQVSDGKGNYNYFPISKQEEMCLWTIQDAKDGDMLEFGDHGRLVTGILSFVNKTTGKVDVSCLLEGDKFKVGVFYNLDTVKPHPATKEQRDLLFQKMKEAGYEWDSEKKELKKIEEPENFKNQVMSEITDLAKDYISQKSTAWSEEDEKILSNIIKDLVHPWNEYIPDRIEDEIKWLKNKLKSLRPQNTWKPSDEQIRELSIVATGKGWFSKEILRELLEQLKKLRKE